MTTSFKPHYFGRYTILDPIAVGGMAEIYRARLTNKGDAPDRIIIIKKVIANLSSNQDFVEMFESEIKITVGLSHPNIVQIFDYGRVDNVSFLAMEYVEGKNLRQFLKRLISMKSMFSIDMSCYIISQVCNAMAYAHAFKDRMTGEHLGIVHRDISPQNIMISYDGAVKLFDFGIAKVRSAGEATQAGVIKGKPSYLSPEQIAGEVLDGRSDIFAIGIVLWEMLTAKRLFVADNDMAILRMIQSAKIESPSTYNPAIPQTLDAIVLKALARDRDKRYKTAEEMQRDLHRFLYSYNPGFNPADLSYYATELFKKEIQEDRERLRGALKITPDPGPSTGGTQLTQAYPGSEAAKSQSIPTEGLITGNEFNREAMEAMLMEQSSQSGEEKAAALEVEKPGTSTSTGMPPRPNLPKGKTQSVSSPGKLNKMPPPPNVKSDELVIPPWVNQSRNPSKQIDTTGLNEAVLDSSTRRRAGTKSLILEQELRRQGITGNRYFILGATVFGVFLILFVGSRVAPDAFDTAFRGTPLEALFVKKSPEQFARNEEDFGREPSAVAGVGAKKDGYGKMKFDINVTNYSVSVNGRPTTIIDNAISVLLGIDLIVEISKPDYETKTIKMRMEGVSEKTIPVQLAKIEKGVLTFITNPGADITLKSAGRKPLSLYTPLRNYTLPAGEYEAIIENATINHKSTVKFKVEPGTTPTVIEKDL